MRNVIDGGVDNILYDNHMNSPMTIMLAVIIALAIGLGAWYVLTESKVDVINGPKTSDQILHESGIQGFEQPGLYTYEFIGKVVLDREPSTRDRQSVVVEQQNTDGEGGPSTEFNGRILLKKNACDLQTNYRYDLKVTYDTVSGIYECKEAKSLGEVGSYGS